MPIDGTKLDEKGLTALVTGGASGFAKEFCRILHEAGANVVVTDMNEQVGSSFVDQLNSDGEGRAAFFKVDVTSWEDQKASFEFAILKYGRIDYVYVIGAIAGITEGRYLPRTSKEPFTKPNLKVMDVNSTGALYTCSLAIQAFRKQGLNRHGYRGKLIVLASTASLYSEPAAPIYTAAKQGIAGFVRCTGKFHREEHITVNAVCPHVTRTGISTEAFYNKMEANRLLTPLDRVEEALISFLGKNRDSGVLLEVSPPDGMITLVEERPYINYETKRASDIVHERGLPLHILED